MSWRVIEVSTSRFMIVRVAVALAITLGLSACEEKAPPLQLKPQSVLVTTVHNVYGSYERRFTAIVSARYESDQGFRSGGKVVARMVDVGQRVVSGQTLARIDPSDYQLAVQAAESQLQAAQIEAEQAASDELRFRRLLVNHSVSDADHERQKARAEAAAARQAQASRQLDIARNRVKYTSLVAEFDGVITSVRFEMGQIVAEGQPIVTIANPSELEVVADLPEEMADSVKTFSAFASFWESQALTAPLKLREISPTAAAQTRTFRAHFSILDNAPAIQQTLHLGMTTKLHLSRKDGERAAVLPATAIWNTDGKSLVLRVEASGNRLMTQPVEVLRYTSEAVLVRGLAEGAKVVSAGIQKLSSGLEVVPVERSASGMNLDMPLAHSSGSGAQESTL